MDVIAHVCRALAFLAVVFGVLAGLFWLIQYHPVATFVTFAALVLFTEAMRATEDW